MPKPKPEKRTTTRVGARMGHEMTATERISELEYKLKAANAKMENLEQKLEEFMKTTEGKVSLLSQEHISLAEKSKMGIEKERHKRLELFKKVHKLNTDEFEKLNRKLDSDRLDHASFAREVSLIRDLIDDLFYKRFGIPQHSSPSKLLSSSNSNINTGSNFNRERYRDGNEDNKTMSSFYISGFEKVNILDQLCMRVAGLEALEAEDEQLKKLKKKIKELSESTAKACTALSGGLSDLHTTNLSIISWADKAHIAIGICADKIGFHGNPCPAVPNLNMHGGALSSSSLSSSSSPSLGVLGASSSQPLSRSRSFNSPANVRRSTFGLGLDS